MEKFSVLSLEFSYIIWEQSSTDFLPNIILQEKIPLIKIYPYPYRLIAMSIINKIDDLLAMAMHVVENSCYYQSNSYTLR